MKRMRFVIALGMLALTALLMSSVFAQDEGTNIRVAHFSPDTPAVDVFVNGEAAVEGLEFGTVTDFINLDAGTYTVAVSPAGAGLEAAAIGPADFDLAEGTFYTAAAIGSLEAGTLTAQVIVEDYSDLGAEDARVTAFHAIEGAPIVDVRAGATVLVDALGYPGTIGDNDGAFTFDVPAGTYDLSITPDGDPTTAILSAPGTALDAGTFYLIAAIGTPDAPEVAVATFTPRDGASARQIESAADRIFSLGQADDGEEDAAEDTAAADDGAFTLADLVVQASSAEPAQFTTLLAAVQAADPAILEALSDPASDLTVFAPSDAAFAELAATVGEETFNAILADTATLTQILQYHVVPQSVDSAAVVGLLEENEGTFVADTLYGEPITVTQTENGIFVDNAPLRVEGGLDFFADNGVVHIIDGVLIPPAIAETLAGGGEEAAAEEEAEPAGATSEQIQSAADRIFGLGGGDDAAEEEGMAEGEEMMAEETPGTIVEIASATEDLSLLVTVLTAAAPDYAEALADPEGEFTVFAPTNAAFEALLSDLGLTAEDALAQPELLRDILGYHVVVGFVDAEGVLGLDGGEVPTLQGEAIAISVMEGSVMLDDTTTVIATDIMASNGVVHLIDSVLVPDSALATLSELGLLETEPAAVEEEEAEPVGATSEQIQSAADRIFGLGGGDDAAEEEGMAEGEEMAEGDAMDTSGMTIAEIATTDENFSTLAMVLTEAAPDYATALSDPEGDFTVFAPTNAAFDDLAAGLGIAIEDALAFPDILIDILGYHVVEGATPAETVLTLDGQSVATIQGEAIAITVTEDGVVLNGAVNVTMTDVQASNGIIHVIDAVMLPQSTIETLQGLGLNP